MENAVITKHKLDFEAAPGKYGFDPVFRIGSCHGLWGSTSDSYYILSVINAEPGNGHLDDVFEWFEFSCKRDGKNLLVLACFNSRFYLHLLSKRGFVPLDAEGENCIKIYNRMRYKKLLKHGNRVIQKGSLTCV